MWIHIGIANACHFCGLVQSDSEFPVLDLVTEADVIAVLQGDISVAESHCDGSGSEYLSSIDFFEGPLA